MEDALIEIYKTAVARLAVAFPEASESEPKVWPRCAALLPHVLAIREHDFWEQEASESGVILLNCTGTYLYGRGA